MGFSLLLTIVVNAVALIYFLDVHARLLADPRGILRAFYLASKEVLHDESMRHFIAMYVDLSSPLLVFDVGLY